MDYSDFIEAARIRQQEDDERRRQRTRQITAARRQNSQSNSGDDGDGRSIIDRIGDALSTAGNAGKGLVESTVKGFTDAASGAKEGIEHVIEDATGVTDERNRKFEESQNQWQDMLIKQLQKSKDETLSEEERAHARDSAASISRNMNQEFEQHQAGLKETIDESDPMKQVGNLLTLTTPAIGGVQFKTAKAAAPVAAPVAATVGGKIAQALTGNVAKTIATDTATGALGGLADPLREKGSDAGVQDLLAGAGLGAALGGGMSGVGEVAGAIRGRNAPMKQLTDAKGNPIAKVDEVVPTNTVRDINAPVASAGRPVGASSTEMASTPTSPARTAPDESDPFDLRSIDLDIDNPAPGSIDSKVVASRPPQGGRFYNKEAQLEATKPKSTLGQKLEENLFDKAARLKNIGKEYTQRTGDTLDASADPYALKRLEVGADEAAEERMKPYLALLKQNKDSGISNAVREYGVARQIVTDRSGDYPPELVREMQGTLDRLETSLSPEELSRVQSSAQAIVDFNDSNLRRLVDNGAMSEDWYSNIKNNNSYYFTPFKFEEYVNGNQRGFARNNSSNNATNIVRGRKGLDDADRFSIEDPYTAVANQTIATENFLARNKTIGAYRKLADAGLENGPVILNDAESINKKIDLQIENKDMRGVRDRLDKTVKRYGRDVRRLETKINQLNKEGLRLSLKNGADRMETTPFAPGGLGGDVPTSRAGQLVKGSENEFNALLDEAAAISKKNPGTQRAADVKEFTTISGAGTRAETNPSQLGPQDTGNFVRNLIENGSRADIDRIKAKISKSDQRLHSMLDEIGLAKSEYDEVASKINANNAEVSDIVAQGKDVPKGYEVLESWENGRKVRVAAPQVLADAFKGKNDIQVGTAEKVLGLGSKTFKQFATVLSPAFSVVDAMRNFQTFVNTSDHLTKAEKSLVFPAAAKYAKGVIDSMMDREIAQTVRLHGGGGSNTLARGTGELSKHIADNLGGVPVKSTENLFEQAAKMISAPIKGYKNIAVNLNRNLEYGAKLAEAEMAIKAGATPEAAALAARNTVGDMQSAGFAGRLLSQYVPFTNSILQGNKRVFDYAKQNPGTFATTVGATVAMPTIAGYAWNQTMYPEVFETIPDYERENNFIIILGDEKNEDGSWSQVLKIPKNEIAKLFGNTIEESLQSIHDKEPLAINELLLKSVGYATPINIEENGEFSGRQLVNSTLTALPAIKGPVQLVTNTDMFSGQDITPDSLQGLAPEDQVKANTGELDKALSKAIGGALNPLETQSLRKTFTAGAFDKNPADSLSGRFVGAKSSRGTNEFYEIKGDVSDMRKRASRAIDQAIAEGDVDGAKQIAQEYNQYRVQQFQPWAQQYGDEADDKLYEQFQELQLDLSKRSMKQRRRNIREKQSQQ